MTKYRLISFIGLFILMGAAWAASTNRKNINPRAILWGISLQFAVALFIFTLPSGAQIFLWLNDAVVRVLGCALAGIQFLFGNLALLPGQTGPGGERPIGFMLAIHALPTIIFFSSLLSVLYYIGLMPRVIRLFARAFTRLMRISGAESLVTTANIFVGVEAGLTAKPYLARMTRSELCLVLTSGMATVASNVLGLYVFSLQTVFPTIAGHLVSASLLAAPAAILMSKLVVPEDETPETLGANIAPYEGARDESFFMAIVNGANEGVKMIVGISALLIAVLGLVALADLGVGAVGAGSLKDICGWVFYPLTLVIGIPPQDAGVLSKIIGERLIVTEVASYRDLAAALSQGLISSPRSAVIATYALCGFAHLASMAIFVGGTAALAPGKIRELTRVAPRALYAATLAGLMTGCVAGIFYNGDSVLFLG